MNSKVTAGIKISVATSYEPQFSNELQDEYLFSYKVFIENHNDFPVRLLHRHWMITDGTGGLRIVDGPGVIGRTPKFEPWGSYNYDSACDFSTTIGKMEGYYIFENLDTGRQFKVDIPAFLMIVPHKLN